MNLVFNPFTLKLDWTMGKTINLNAGEQYIWYDSDGNVIMRLNEDDGLLETIKTKENKDGIT